MIQVIPLKVKIYVEGSTVEKDMYCLQCGQYAEFHMIEAGEATEIIGSATTSLMKRINEARNKVSEQSNQEA